MISFQRDFFAYFLKRKIFLRVVWERCWEIRFQSDCWGRSRVQVNIIIIVKKMWLKFRASYVIFFLYGRCVTLALLMINFNLFKKLLEALLFFHGSSRKVLLFFSFLLFFQWFIDFFHFVPYLRDNFLFFCESSSFD